MVYAPKTKDIKVWNVQTENQIHLKCDTPVQLDVLYRGILIYYIG